ncbi:cupin domain-containing protein [Methanocalculus taiwanensis]|uniref:cupin domain-containing protein n=1 Tax=Methanocalculus taiwanensis TaxID=106207 RepID=UPI0021018923
MPRSENESIIGVTIMPRDMIIYQENTIASRTLIMSKEGTVTLFAFDKGQGLSEHTAPFDALAYALDGEAEITIAKTPHYLREGNMIIMPADIPHAVQPIGRFKMMLIMIHAGKGDIEREAGEEEKEDKKKKKEARKLQKKREKEDKKKKKEARKLQKKREKEDKKKKKEARKLQKKREKEDKKKKKEARKLQKKREKENQIEMKGKTKE